MRTYFGNYSPSSFGWEQGNIVPFTYRGVSFPAGVHPLAAPIFTALLDRLVPLLPNGLHDGWCWGFDAGSVSSGGSPSFHTYGTAIDINAPVNPFLPRGGSAAHEIPDAAGAIARELGCEWGGNWTSPVDYMHFDIHLDPAGAAELAGQLHTPAPIVPEEEDDMILIYNTPPSSPYLLSGGILCEIRDGKTVQNMKEAGVKEAVWAAADFKQALTRYGR